jgi:flagellar hook-associated protein 1 FlgK
LITDLGTDAGSASKFGIQIGNYSLTNQTDTLTIKSTNDSALSIATSASSLADQRVKMTNLPAEDLIVLLSGSGANRITANYDIAPSNGSEIEENITIKVIDDTGINVEILDAQTGHSIATRSLDANLTTEAEGYFIQLTDKGIKNDTFQIAANKDGTGDARNLDAILKLQSGDSGTGSRGNFQEIFSGIVATIGSGVQASKLRTESAEALKDSAEGFESQFSGVNLDEEAANLIEQQQAYQASARILSTARELFDTLLESV